MLWKERYPLLTLMAANTQRMRLGTCVTNPATRDLTVTASLFATLNLISGGRMELGIGRGDSSRRVMGKKPVSWSQLEAAVKEFRDLTSGKEVEHDGQPTRLTWAKIPLRVWIAGYGPKVLHMAGRVADGIILQFADPALIAWCMGFVKEGARAAGRDPARIEVMAAAPVWVSDDLNVARERVRWFPALVSNHVMDLIRQYKPEDLPPASDFVCAGSRPATTISTTAKSIATTRNLFPTKSSTASACWARPKRITRNCAIWQRRRHPVQYLSDVRR